MGNSSSSSTQIQRSESNEDQTPFKPTESWKPKPEDIFKVNQFLTQKGNLPNEINYEILNLAEYWSEDEINLNQTIIIDHLHQRKSLFDLDLLNDLKYMKFVLNWFQERKSKFETQDEFGSNRFSSSLGEVEDHQLRRLTAKVMKIEWKIVSHDQGWSSYPEDHGTYTNSWTWTEATLYDRSSTSTRLPTDHSLWYRVSTNIHARRQPTLHQSIWYPDHPFLIDLNQRLSQISQSNPLNQSIGFVLAAVAQFPGWENTIESIQCSIFYSFL